MKKIIWIPLIIIAVGVVIAVVGCTSGGIKGLWVDREGMHLASTDLGKLVKVDESYQGFTNIVVNADFFDSVVLKEGDGFTVKGQNYERYGGLNVKLDGDTLKVEARHEGGWNINFGIDELFNGLNKDVWLVITYPKDAAFGDVTVNVSASNVNASGIKCKDLTVEDSFGNVDVTSIKCDSLRIDANSGKVSLNGAEVGGDAVISDDFGDVELTGIQAGSLDADLNSGDMTIDKASAGSFSVKNDFGKIEINEASSDSMFLKLNSGELKADNVKTGDLTIESSFGNISIDRLAFTGMCDIKNNSGDVNIGLLMNEDDLSYELNVDAGDITVGDRKSSGSVTNRVSGAAATLNAECDFGNIKVRFLQ